MGAAGGLLALFIPAVIPAAAFAAAGTDLMIVFDTSGSMNDSVGGRRKLEVAKEGMWKFIQSLPSAGTRVGLVTFDFACETLVRVPLGPLTKDRRELLKRTIAELKAEGSTPIGDALGRALGQFDASPSRKRVLVMTDGEETCSESKLQANSDAAWDRKIKVYAVGFAFGQMPSKALRRLGIYKDANDDKQLASVFSEIGRSLEREDGRYDERKAAPAQADRPAVSWTGRAGAFKPGKRLYKTLQLDSSYEQAFGPGNHFTAMDHGYHIRLNEAEYQVDRLEVLRVRLHDDNPYGPIEGFVHAEDVNIQ